MAIQRLDGRRGERGLSIIEALVIVSITALLALLLLPLVSRAGGRNFGLADRGLDAAEASVAEAQWRTLLAGALQQPEGASSLEGRSDSVLLVPGLAAAVSCAPAGASHWVRLRIEQRRAGGGRLLCEVQGGRTEMLRWRRGAAAFSFSGDGRVWSPTWTERTPAPGVSVVATHQAPLARFELSSDGEPTISWVQHAGSTEAVEMPVDEQG